MPAGARPLAVDLARRAGAVLRQRASGERVIRHKGLVDIVTDADLESEQLIRDWLHAAFPEHGILGEEGGATGDRLDGFWWLVDPLDGTTNYAHRFPFYSVSIALQAGAETLLGVVYDPSRDELFVAERGQGATLNGAPIRVSGQRDLASALVSTGFPYDRDKIHRATVAFERVSMRVQAVRRAGSAALDLCYVACGRFDSYWEFVIQPWDIAAGVLLVQEAGGTVTKVDGSPFTVTCGEVLATNGVLYPDVLALVGSL